MIQFTLEQLEEMLAQIGENEFYDHPYKSQVIRALQNRIADYYLNNFLGGVLFDDPEPNEAIRRMFGGK